MLCGLWLYLEDIVVAFFCLVRVYLEEEWAVVPKSAMVRVWRPGLRSLEELSKRLDHLKIKIIIIEIQNETHTSPPQNLLLQNENGTVGS